MPCPSLSAPSNTGGGLTRCIGADIVLQHRVPQREEISIVNAWHGILIHAPAEDNHNAEKYAKSEPNEDQKTLNQKEGSVKHLTQL
jgi:hypothetical protein